MDSSNEADSKQDAQPRLSFPAQVSGGSGINVSRHWNRIWAVIVSLCVFLIAFVTVRTAPEIKETPPPLQTFVKSKSRPAPPPLTRVEKKKTTEPIIRVNVTPGGVESFEMEIRGPYQLISLESNETFPAGILSSRASVRSTKRGIKIGTYQSSTSRIEIQSSQSPAIRVNGHLYRGQMKLYRRSDGLVSAVNILPIEEYLASVVDSEMPASFPDAARQAQAIVARTYALYQIQQADPYSVFDLLSSQRSQKYLGVEYLDSKGRRLAGESDSSRRAVKATRGLTCTWQKKLFCTYYSAVCGGRTTNGHEVFKDAVDALKSVPCEWCDQSPHYRWTTEIPLQDFQQRSISSSKTEKNGVTISAIDQVQEPGKGYISRFAFNHAGQRTTVTGIQLRERLPAGTLFSPHFRIKLQKDRVVFEGQGHGHGVGFCQWGAKGQAESGRNSIEIVKHYYPGVELVDLDY